MTEEDQEFMQEAGYILGYLRQYAVIDQMGRLWAETRDRKFLVSEDQYIPGSVCRACINSYYSTLGEMFLSRYFPDLLTAPPTEDEIEKYTERT